MTTAELNQKYFDSISSTYDTKPWWAKANAQVSSALRSRLSWLGIPFANTGSNPATADVRLLDYACGTGLMSRAFGPYVTTTRAIDVSPNMVATYNSRMHAAGLSPDRVHAIAHNLFDKNNPCPEELAGPEWRDFDVAAVGFGFHHFDDVVFAASQLRGRLRPGGVLVITDFLEGGDEGVDGEGDGREEGVVRDHGREHSHGHGEHSHGHGGHSHGHHSHGHDHSHHHHHHAPPTHDTDDTSPAFKQKMDDSIVVPHFSVAGVKAFFAEAGLVDVDVVTLEEKTYMQFAGKEMWRTVLVAKGRRPEEEGRGEKGEL